MRDFWKSVDERERRPQFGLDPRDEWMLLSAALTLAGCVFLSSFSAPELFPVALHVLTFGSGLIASLVALVTGQGVFDDHFTGWDQAAAYFAVALISGLFVDVAAIMEILEPSQTEVPTAMGSS